ncbi:MAG: GGDEF domain-containing protein [Rhodopseudomonas palustris]|nr:GGDEF domain-containing protein [Rhodopseudomonas palustris]
MILEATFNAIIAGINSGQMVTRTDHTVFPGQVMRIIEQPTAGWRLGRNHRRHHRMVQNPGAHGPSARHDPLTDLPNRFTLREELDRALRYSRREVGVAILYIDLDHFKEINDTLGHPVGDALLIEVAHRLVGCVRGEDTVARLGGDEFAIIQISHHDPESDAAALAMRIVSVTAAVPCRNSGPSYQHRHQHRQGTCAGACRRHRTRSADQECRSGTVPRQIRRPRRLSVLRVSTWMPMPSRGGC